MIKTLNYLEENHIGSLEKLKKKVRNVNREFQEVSGMLKKIERQMKENRELQNHMVNYVKTKEVYMKYRRSGYDKKFYEQHVDAFGKVEEKKVPKMKKQ